MRTKHLHPTIDVPASVEVSQDGSVTIPVRVKLENTCDDAIVLASPQGDDPHFCHVLNAQQREVCRTRDPSDEAEDHVSITVFPQYPVNRTFEIEIPCGKLKDGQEYTVRALIYGHGAEATFVAIKPKKPKKAAAKKASAKKASKKAGGKKNAKKKAAGKKKSTKKTKKKKRAA